MTEQEARQHVITQCRALRASWHTQRGVYMWKIEIEAPHGMVWTATGSPVIESSRFAALDWSSLVPFVDAGVEKGGRA